MKDTNLVSVTPTTCSSVSPSRRSRHRRHQPADDHVGAKDIQLKQWTVTDPQGYDTTIAVYNLDTTKKARSRPVQDRLHQLQLTPPG